MSAKMGSLRTRVKHLDGQDGSLGFLRRRGTVGKGSRPWGRGLGGSMATGLRKGCRGGRCTAFQDAGRDVGPL